jgi:hypothetical protein
MVDLVVAVQVATAVLAPAQQAVLMDKHQWDMVQMQLIFGMKARY